MSIEYFKVDRQETASAIRHDSTKFVFSGINRTLPISIKIHSESIA
jgi:hypothetical protein